MKFANKILSELRSINKYSKLVFRTGGTVIWLIYLTAVALYILAGTKLDYYFAVDLSQQLIDCIKPCMGVTLLSMIVAETIVPCKT